MEVFGELTVSEGSGLEKEPASMYTIASYAPSLASKIRSLILYVAPGVKPPCVAYKGIVFPFNAVPAIVPRNSGEGVPCVQFGLADVQ